MVDTVDRGESTLSSRDVSRNGGVTKRSRPIAYLVRYSLIWEPGLLLEHGPLGLGNGIACCCKISPVTGEGVDEDKWFKEAN